MTTFRTATLLALATVFTACSDGSSTTKMSSDAVKAGTPGSTAPATCCDPAAMPDPEGTEEGWNCCSDGTWQGSLGGGAEHTCKATDHGHAGEICGEDAGTPDPTAPATCCDRAAMPEVEGMEEGWVCCSDGTWLGDTGGGPETSCEMYGRGHAGNICGEVCSPDAPMHMACQECPEGSKGYKTIDGEQTCECCGYYY